MSDESDALDEKMSAYFNQVPDEKCETCRFWDANTQARPHIGVARCRALPPVAQSSRSDAYPVWPTTGHRDWCGGWAAMRGE